MNQALLKVQIGPVQEFIAQARSTRDLWSGSYLISWMMAHSVKAVTDRCGMDALIFPSAQHQPLLEWLESPRSNPQNAEEILTPNLPNVFLAEVPEADGPNLAAAVSDIFAANHPDSEWSRICAACLSFLDQVPTPFTGVQRNHWQFQVSHHWQVTWQLWPLLDGDPLKNAFVGIPPIVTKPVATANWNANFQLVSHRLDARRQIREFDAWQSSAPSHKDHFSGKEEVIADRDWLARAQANHEDDERGLPFLFRNNDELGAINLIKRVWHKAYLAPDDEDLRKQEPKRNLDRARRAFDSVPDVAAAPWRESLRTRLLAHNAPPSLDAAFGAFTVAVQQGRSLLAKEDWEIAQTIPRSRDSSYENWLRRADLALFNPTTWDSRGNDPVSEPLLRQVADALNDLTAAAGLGQPDRYYAVLALDGDGMGKWISGGKTGGIVSRGTHQEFSGKLSHFALRVRRVVLRFGGKVIFSGGDDVLALLPATTALACARVLLKEFRDIKVKGDHLTASAGLAIGHIKAPLQDMVQEARDAEARAKRPPERSGWDRDALAVTLYKRSGEMIQWGAKFDSPAFDLLRLFRRHYRPPLRQPGAAVSISAKLPHRVAEMLGKFGAGTVLDDALSGLCLAEFRWIATQQTHKAGSVKTESHLETLRNGLVKRADVYLKDLVHGPAGPRPLAEFYHLFALEAFITRQED